MLHEQHVKNFQRPVLRCDCRALESECGSWCCRKPKPKSNLICIDPGSGALRSSGFKGALARLVVVGCGSYCSLYQSGNRWKRAGKCSFKGRSDSGCPIFKSWDRVKFHNTFYHQANLHWTNKSPTSWKTHFLSPHL